MDVDVDVDRRPNAKCKHKTIAGYY
jgi:hypothetical protein